MQAAFYFVLLMTVTVFLAWQFGENSFQKTHAAGQSQFQYSEKVQDSSVFAEFDKWLAEHLNGDFSNDIEHIEKGERLAEKRRELFKQLIQTSPQAALERAVRAEVYQNLPETIVRHLEKPFNARGDFLVRVFDETDVATGELANASTERIVVFDGVKYKAFVYGQKTEMTTKYDIPLRGIILENAAAIDENPARKIESAELSSRNLDPKIAGENAVAAEIGGEIFYFSDSFEFHKHVSDLAAWEDKIAPERLNDLSPWTEGAKTLLFIRVDFAERAGEPIDINNAPLTSDRAQNVINNSVNQFFATNSYNKTSITATVTPVVRMPQPQSFYTGANSDLIFDHARAAARAAGFETNNYNQDIIAFSWNPIFSYAGFANIGGKGLVLNGHFDFKTAAHEIGHCYGLLHANLWRTTDGTPIGSGSNIEYGDAFDVMGSGGTQLTQFNASYKRNLDWLTEANVQTATRTGVYRVFAFDTETAAPEGIRALKIRKDGAKNYWLEFRQSLSNVPALANGALVRWDFPSQGRRQTQVLDMTPGTTSQADAPLLIGQSFSDNAAGLKITVLGKGNTTPESLDIKVEFNYSIIKGAPFDFDGDNKSDIGVFRPANGAWYLNNSSTGFFGVLWGLPTDKIVPAKFNPDRTTDIAVYRNGNWYVYNSFGGNPIIVQFGSAEDIPVPADYDGDGVAEMAVYRPSNGGWYMWNWISRRFTAFQFGVSTDKPIPADYDGDGKTDIAVYRPENGGWYIQQTELGFTAVQFGMAEDKPIPADFDGDGRADVAVFRPESGAWYRLNSSDNQFVAQQFGIAEDKPAPADYDGDGKADIAVFRPSNGAWYRLNSSNNQFTGQIFGTNGDIPVSAAFNY